MRAKIIEFSVRELPGDDYAQRHLLIPEMDNLTLWVDADHLFFRKIDQNERFDVIRDLELTWHFVDKVRSLISNSNALKSSVASLIG